MADNLQVSAGVGNFVAFNNISGVLYQRMKLNTGSAGNASDAACGIGTSGTNGSAGAALRVTIGSDDPVSTALAAAQGSTTSGQNGPLIQGAVTTAAPSYTTAQTSPLSLTTAGNLRVQDVNGALTQGSTTSGQNGTLIQGAVTTAAPSYTNAQTSPLSLTTAGALRTQDTGSLGQGSTTSGQNGFLELGAVTTSAPSYTTAQSSALSLTTAGQLRVLDTGANVAQGSATSGQTRRTDARCCDDFRSVLHDRPDIASLALDRWLPPSDIATTGSLAG